MKNWSTESSEALKAAQIKDLATCDRRFLALAAKRGFKVANASYERLGAHVSAFRLHPRQPESAPRGTVVIAHATGNDSLYPHADLVLAVLSAGFDAFLFDLDGHGRRSTTRLDPARAKDMIHEALRQAASVNSAPAHLIGQSLGGALALAAVADGAPARTLTLISAPIALRLSASAIASELLSVFRPAYWGLTQSYGVSGLLPALGSFRRSDYPVRLSVDGIDYPKFVDRLVLELNLQAEARKIDSPTLLVYGSRDGIVPLEQGQALVGLIPHAELVVARGATHFTTPLERESCRSICDFLLAKSET